MQHRADLSLCQPKHLRPEFALEPTENNVKFLYSFVKLLLTKGGAELEPEDDDMIHKAVHGMYLLDPENRRLSTFPAQEA